MSEERTRALRRKANYRKAIRKKRISETYGFGSGWYSHLGQYIKGKIHCSCLGCTSYNKTNSKGRWCGDKKNKKNWKPSDLKKIESMNLKMKEEYSQ